MNDAVEPYVVTITERGSQIYTGTSVGYLSAAMLAQVTLMMHGAFGGQTEVITEEEGLSDTRVAIGGRTLDVRIESHSHIMVREAERSAFDEVVSGFEETS